jgi:hypothetical protein
MSPDEDADKPSRQLLLKEADRLFEQQIDFTNVATEPVTETIAAVEVTTETVTEFLPVVIPTETVDAGGAPDLGPSSEDTYVPEDDEQKLIYHWLVYGPEWRADIVVAPPPDDISIPSDPVVNPLHFPRPRQIGHRDDGTRRMIKVRE